MSRSNITKKANIYIRRQQTPLLNDQSFLSQVRGLRATRQLLKIMGVPPENWHYEDSQVRRFVREGKLTKRQHNCLRWEIPCAQCNSVPVGFTFGGDVEFRCERQDCLNRRVDARRLLVPDWAPGFAITIRFEEALAWAVKTLDGKPPTVDLEAESRLPIVLRVGPTLEALYSDDELVCLLVYGLKHYRR
jgi:hypothetical protein